MVEYLFLLMIVVCLFGDVRNMNLISCIVQCKLQVNVKDKKH